MYAGLILRCLAGCQRREISPHELGNGHWRHTNVGRKASSRSPEAQGTAAARLHLTADSDRHVDIPSFPTRTQAGGACLVPTSGWARRKTDFSENMILCVCHDARPLQRGGVPEVLSGRPAPGERLSRQDSQDLGPLQRALPGHPGGPHQGGQDCRLTQYFPVIPNLGMAC